MPRWVTITAIRILRLYVSSSETSQNCKDMATFVIKVYDPIWFHIKFNSSCIHGPQNILRMITFFGYLPQHQKEVINTVIQRNDYFAHHENILLGMMADVRIQIREIAFRCILNVKNHSVDKAV